MNVLTVVAVPPTVVTEIVPDAAAPGMAVICVAELTTYDEALTPPNSTAVTPVKFVPVITTGAVKAHPLDGEKLAIVGGTGTTTLKV